MPALIYGHFNMSSVPTEEEVGENNSRLQVLWRKSCCAISHLSSVMPPVLVLFAATSVPAAQSGTARRPRPCLRERSAVKEDKAKALDMFNKEQQRLQDHDLYVFCANVSDGVLNGSSSRCRTFQNLEGSTVLSFGSR